MVEGLAAKLWRTCKGLVAPDYRRRKDRTLVSRALEVYSNKGLML